MDGVSQKKKRKKSTLVTKLGYFISKVTAAGEQPGTIPIRMRAAQECRAALSL